MCVCAERTVATLWQQGKVEFGLHAEVHASERTYERMDFVGMQDTGALDGRGRQMT